MGIAVAAQSSVIGGQNDPASPVLDNSGGTFNGKWMPIPPLHGTPASWLVVGYHKGAGSPPSKTWVAFAKYHDGAASVTINGATFDLRGVVPGEVLLYTAYGDGTVANPWQVTSALSVFRGTGGALDTYATSRVFPGLAVAYDFTTFLGITTVTDYTPHVSGPVDLPFAATYDSLDGPYDPLSLNLGFVTDVWWNSSIFFSLTPSRGWTACTFVVGPGPASYTTNAWVPDGLGAAGVQPPQSWFQSQGVNQEWGLPDQTNLKCRVYTANDQFDTSIPTMKIASGGLDNFFVQGIMWDSDAAQLEGIAARLAAEGGTGFGGPSDGHPDVLAMRVRPQFIDQANEAGGGIFIESHS